MCSEVSIFNLEDTGVDVEKFEDTDVEVVKLQILWYYAARYGSLGVIEWAHQCGYSRLWEDFRAGGEDGGFPIGKATCAKAAEYGQLDALQLLRQHGCRVGIAGLVRQQLVVGILPSSNGRERMDATGVVGLAGRQLAVDISLSSNG